MLKRGREGIEGLKMDLYTEIDQCGFSQRVNIIFKMNHIYLVRDLLKLYECDLLRFKYFGTLSFKEVKDFLEENNLKLMNSKDNQAISNLNQFKDAVFKRLNSIESKIDLLLKADKESHEEPNE